MKNKSLEAVLIICVVSAVISFSASCSKNKAIPDTDPAPSPQQATENAAIPEAHPSGADANPQVADTTQKPTETGDIRPDEAVQPSAEPGQVPAGEQPSGDMQVAGSGSDLDVRTPLKAGEICNEGNCPCGTGFCPKGAVCDGKTCICGINRDENYEAGSPKPCNGGDYFGYTCQRLEKKTDEGNTRGFDSVWASSLNYGDFSCEYLDVHSSHLGPEQFYSTSFVWGFMCKNPRGCYHRTEHYAPVPPNFNPRSETVPGKNFEDSRFAEWPDLDYEWNDRQARVFTAVTHYDRDKCPYHIDGDTDTTEETICRTGDCVLPLKDGVCSLIDVHPYASVDPVNNRILEFDAAACPGGTLYCHGRANAPIPRPEHPKGYACQTIEDRNGKVQRELKSWVCNAGDCSCGDDLCFYGNACVCGGKACLPESVCYNGRCIPPEEVPNKEGKVFRRPKQKSPTMINRYSCDYYYTTDAEYLGYCGSDSAETMPQETKFRDDFADLLATLHLIPSKSIENDRCLTRRMCDPQHLSPDQRVHYFCDHGLFMLETNQPGKYIAADRPLGLRCNDPNGCTCGDRFCPEKSICTNLRNNGEDDNKETYCRYDSVFMLEACDKPTVDMNNVFSMLMFWKSYKDQFSESSLKEDDNCPPMKEKWKEIEEQSRKLNSGLGGYDHDISNALNDLIKVHRIEFKNSDVKWETIESDYPLPEYKLSVDKDIVHELSLITKKTATRLADNKVSDGTGIQVFECTPFDIDEAVSSYMSLIDENDRYYYGYLNRSIDENNRYYYGYINRSPEVIKKRSEIENTEAIVIYIGFVAQDDKIARVYRVNSEHDTMKKFMKCAGPDNEPAPSFEFVDAIQNSWLDTTAYTIRIKSGYETVHDHACDSPCGCDVINTYNTLHSYVFAGNKFRPVADWREIDLWEQDDYMAGGDYLYNKEEEECDGLVEDEYEKCRYKHDEDGNRMMDPEEDCPSKYLSTDCQKAILIDNDLSILKVRCK